MRLKTRILAPWLLFAVLLLGVLAGFGTQLSALHRELGEHIALHQQAVRIARDLRYLSLERLVTVLGHDPSQTEQVMAGLAASEQATEQAIAELDHLLTHEIHEPLVEGDDQGRGILASYARARGTLPDLYRRWLEARAAPGAFDEPLRRRQLTQQFNLVAALLEDLSQYLDITQQLVVDRTNARVERTQVYLYGLIVAALLVVIALAVHQGYSIAAPLRALSHAARTLAQGGDARFDQRSSVDEIETLRDAISRMVGQLKAYLEQLSARQDEILGQMARMARVGGWELDLATRKVTWTDEVYRIHEVDLGAEPPLERAIEFYAPEARPLIEAAIERAIAEGTPWDLELPFITARGRHLWVRTQGRPVFRDGRAVRLNGAFQDITGQKQAMDAIRQANADLEAFSYSVSHDLRAPLRAIDGFIEMLLDGHADQLDDEGRRMFGVVQDNARKMGHLIDDILAFSRAGRLELDWQRVDMQGLVGEVWAGLEEAGAGHAVLLQTDALPTVWGDPRALRQICVNLLSNAIKFSRARQPGQVRMSATREGDWARFSVQDNGVGFDPAYVDKLFVMFQRLHGMDEFEGTGVGLAIVKRFVQKHGGRVQATATPGGGATFSFTVLLHAGAQGAVTAGEGAPGHLPAIPRP